MANEPALFVDAERALLAFVERISDGQWDQPVPDDFPMAWAECRPTLRDAVDYVAHDDAWVPHVLDGTEGPPMASRRHRPCHRY